MADPDNQFDTGESNNFDNDFEKVDSLGGEESPPPAADVPEADMLGLGDDQLVSSTSPDDGEDLYSAPEPAAPPESTEPLVSLDDPVPQFSSDPLVAPLVPGAADPPISDFGLKDVEEEKEVPKPREPSPPRQPEPVPEPVPDPVTEVKPISSKKPAPSTGSGQPWIKSIDPRVIDLIYWRDVKKTGIVFGSIMVLLLSLALFSVLSVMAYLSLAALTVTITFVVYKKVMGAVQKTGEGHPFKQYLEMDISLPEEKVHQVADVIMRNLSTTVRELRRLFLVEDIVDSLKFGLLLWVLTYIGAWFNGMTILILDVVGLFTLPKFYETYKVQIDQYLDIAKTKVKEVMKQVQEKIPMPGKKKQA